MKIGFRVFPACIILLLGISAIAQDEVYKPVSGTEISLYVEKIEKVSASLTSLSCSFTQKKIITVLAESVVSKGNLVYKKENKLCWEYLSPYYYLFALNGDKVYIKNDKSISQFDTKSNALFKEISLLLVNSISGAGLIDPKKFDVDFYENTKTLQARLIPKNKTLKSLLSTITLYFGKTTYLVFTIEMTEPSGDTTTIVFSDVKLNEPISDEKFVVH
jgi:outer membrane lipoprotein carrier protein